MTITDSFSTLLGKTLWPIMLGVLLSSTTVLSQIDRPRLIAQLGHSGQVTSVTFSPNGKLIATGGETGEVILWEVTSRHALRRLRAHNGTVKAMLFRAGGDELVTVGFDKMVKIWEVRTGREIKAVIMGQDTFIDKVEILPTGASFVTSGFSIITLWDIASGTPLGQYRGDSDFSISPDGKQLATISDNKPQIIEIATSRRATLTDKVASIVRFSPRGHYLVTHGTDDILRLWNTETKKEVKKVTAREFYGDSALFSLDERKVVLFDKTMGYNFFIWDISSGKVTKPLPDDQHVYAAAFSPDGSIIALGGERGALLWDVSADRIAGGLKGSNTSVGIAVPSPDGKYYAVGDNDGIAHLWEVKAGREIAQFKGHTKAITSLAFDPKTHLLATASEDKTARLWNINRGET
jgi:WD40 repeat protein